MSGDSRMSRLGPVVQVYSYGQGSGLAVVSGSSFAVAPALYSRRLWPVALFSACDQYNAFTPSNLHCSTDWFMAFWGLLRYVCMSVLHQPTDIVLRASRFEQFSSYAFDIRLTHVCGNL